MKSAEDIWHAAKYDELEDGLRDKVWIHKKEVKKILNIYLPKCIKNDFVVLNKSDIDKIINELIKYK